MGDPFTLNTTPCGDFSVTRSSERETYSASNCLPVRFVQILASATREKHIIVRITWNIWLMVAIFIC